MLQGVISYHVVQERLDVARLASHVVSTMDEWRCTAARDALAAGAIQDLIAMST